MAVGKFTHTIAQIDSAIDSINAIAAKFGVNAILPMTVDEYNAIISKDGNTLYIVYSGTNFRLFYGVLPLSGAGGSSAGSFVTAMSGGAGGGGSLTAPVTP